MTTAKELCSAIVKYFIDFGSKLFLLLSPLIKVIAFLKVSFQHLIFQAQKRRVYWP